MTTVFVSRPKPATVNLFQLMQAWMSRDDAVYPYDAVYSEDATQKSSEAEGRAEMASSQDLAVAAALEELGYQVEIAVVAKVIDGQPADGILEAGDEIAAVNGAKIDGASAVGEAVAATPAGQDVELDIVRKGEKQTVTHHAGRAGRQALPRDRADLPLRVPVRRLAQHRPRHRRPERRTDVLARHLRHA